VPIRVNPLTGFAMVDATIDGAPHRFVIDNGGSYSAIRSTAALIAAHPDWLRARGGIGEANLTMQSIEAGVLVVKARDVALGDLKLDELGVVELGNASSGLLTRMVSDLFWERVYSPRRAKTSTAGWPAMCSRSSA